MYDHIIITERASEMKAMGRQALRGKWVMAALTEFVFVLIGMVPGTLVQLFLGSFIGYAYSFLIVAPLQLGLVIFYLKLFRNIKASTGDLFGGFEHFLKILGLQIVIFGVTFLWCFPVAFVAAFLRLSRYLVLIPAIAVYLRYYFAPYILADNPEKGVMQCINECKWLMKGNKWKLFCLFLSFLGWAILLVAAMLLVAIIVGLFVYDIGISQATAFWSIYLTEMLIGLAGYFFLGPYIKITTVAFYEILCGRLNVRPVPVYDGWQDPNGWQNGQNQGWNNPNQGWPGGPSGQNPQNGQNWQQNNNGWASPQNQNPNQGQANPFEAVPMGQPYEEEPQYFGFREDGSANTGEEPPAAAPVGDDAVSVPDVTMEAPDATVQVQESPDSQENMDPQDTDN